MKAKISPSMMCADICRIKETVEEFEKNNIEYLHIDIMDGHFVKNFTLGTDYCKALKEITSIPLDIHLMIEKPEEKLDWFPFGKSDIVSVHAESTPNIQKSLQIIRSREAKAFIAINPETDIDMIKNMIDDIDGVLVMTVNPGFAGQKMISSTLDKIKKVREYLDISGRNNISVEVDGNVSFENCVKMKEAGADIFVAGTSSVFTKDLSLSESIAKMQNLLERKSTLYR